MEDPTSMMIPLYQGLTCLPNTNASANSLCTMGGYPVYTINAKEVSDIQNAVNFARETGIRLVIKNTGHDFSGKSGGAGSLSIWTHHFKNIEFIEKYAGDSVDGYSGPAFKAGSGVQAFEMYEFAKKHELIVVGGEGRVSPALGEFWTMC